MFDSEFGLPAPPSFMKYNQTGGTTLPPAAPPNPIDGWGIEIALDVEWAHAMAPAANIDLVEADTDTNNLSDLMLAANTAATKLGASVVSMSFGMDFEANNGGGTIEQMLDSTYLAPAFAADPGVTFLAGSGDTEPFRAKRRIIRRFRLWWWQSEERL